MSQPFPPPPSPYGAHPPTSNGVAITALVFGILAILAVFTVIGAFVAFVPGVAAIVVGIFGVRKAGEHPAGPGRGSAIAGIVCGSLATLASIAAFAIVALFVASSDLDVAYFQGASAEDYEMSAETCLVDDGRAIATGVLTNVSRRDAAGFAVTVVFSDGSGELGTIGDEMESGLAVGESWAWEVSSPVDTHEVSNFNIECQVLRVERGYEGSS